MCGRAALGLSDQQLVALFSSRPLLQHQQQQYQPSYNIRPTTATPIVRRRQGQNELILLSWGIPLPNSSKNVINARCEGIRQKPMFRSLLEKQRCVMPIIGFYEWSPDRRPHLIKVKDQLIMNLACLYTNADAFVIITCDAAPAISSIHDRMPVVLTDDQLDKWLDVDRFSFADCQQLLAPFKGELQFWQVNPLRGNDQSCIEPVSGSPQTRIDSYLKPKLKTESSSQNDPAQDRKRRPVSQQQQQQTQQHSPKKVKNELPHEVDAEPKQSHDVKDQGNSDRTMKADQEHTVSPRRTNQRLRSSPRSPSSDQKQSAITDFFKRKQS